MFMQLSAAMSFVHPSNIFSGLEAVTVTSTLNASRFSWAAQTVTMGRRCRGRKQAASQQPDLAVLGGAMKQPWKKRGRKWGPLHCDRHLTNSTSNTRAVAGRPLSCLLLARPSARSVSALTLGADTVWSNHL